MPAAWRVEAPGVERRVVSPSPAGSAPRKWTNLAELARLDHLARAAHRRDEAVVEGAHMLTPAAATACQMS